MLKIFDVLYKQAIFLLIPTYLMNERNKQLIKETKESIANDSKHPMNQYF